MSRSIDLYLVNCEVINEIDVSSPKLAVHVLETS